MFEKTKKEIHSMNDGLPVLYAEELEQRLETDPLGVSNLFDQIAELNDDSAQSRISCKEYCKDNCIEYTECKNNCSDDCGTYCEGKCQQKKST